MTRQAMLRKLGKRQKMFEDYLRKLKRRQKKDKTFHSELEPKGQLRARLLAQGTFRQPV